MFGLLIAYLSYVMELRRHKDIIAFKTGGSLPVALHARNLEVAELSNEAWESMSVVDLASSNPMTELVENEASQTLKLWNLEQNSETKSGQLSFGIRSITLNVTQICNLHCTYCAAGGDGTFGDPQTKISVEKTLPQIKFLLEKIPVGESFHITFLGGEPLLYPEAIELIAEYVNLMTAGRKISTTFSVVTNGTLINDKALQVLTKIKSNVSISIDGPAEINDKTRPQRNGKGSTATVIEGIQKLTAVKDQLGRLILHAVFSKENMQITKAYEFFGQFNVDYYEFTYSVDTSDESSSAMYNEQMKLVADLAYARGGEKELRKITLFDRYFNALDNQQQTENYCGAGKSYLMIDARNQVYTCPWEVGNKKDQVGTGSFIDTEKLEELAKPLIEKNNCQTCWARFMCGGGCMFIHKSKTGSKHQKDLNFCIRTRDLISTTILLYKKSRVAC